MPMWFWKRPLYLSPSGQKSNALTIIRGEEGRWDVGDTIGTFPVPECMPTPQRAEIINHQGSKALRLVSEVTECADNVWVALARELNKKLSVPITLI